MVKRVERGRGDGQLVCRRSWSWPTTVGVAWSSIPAPSEGRWCRWFSVGEKQSGKVSSVSQHRSHATPPTMPLQKVVSTPYKLIDADPHASRVVSYMRPSDYVVWGGATAAAPATMYLWGEHFEITRNTDRFTDHPVCVTRPC